VRSDSGRSDFGYEGREYVVKSRGRDANGDWRFEVQRAERGTSTACAFGVRRDALTLFDITPCPPYGRTLATALAYRAFAALAEVCPPFQLETATPPPPAEEAQAYARHYCRVYQSALATLAANAPGDEGARAALVLAIRVWDEANGLFLPARDTARVVALWREADALLARREQWLERSRTQRERPALALERYAERRAQWLCRVADAPAATPTEP